jgi:NADH-quinone oxidoreductase subunit I
VCPFDALHWSPEFEYSELDIRDLLHEKDRLGAWMPTVPPPPALDPGSAEPAEIAAINKPARTPRAAGPPATARPATSRAATAPPARAARPGGDRVPRDQAEAAAAADEVAQGRGAGAETTPHSPPASEKPPQPEAET